jgi:hypothetical protein
MRPTGFWALAGLIVVCVALADAIAHPSGTTALTSAGVKAETTALDAELGKTS